MIEFNSKTPIIVNSQFLLAWWNASLVAGSGVWQFQVCTSKAFNCPAGLHHQGVTPSFMQIFSIHCLPMKGQILEAHQWMACILKVKYNFFKNSSGHGYCPMLMFPGLQIIFKNKEKCHMMGQEARCNCDDDTRGPPKQLRQAAYATQPADAAGPNAQMITMPPGVYIIQSNQGCKLREYICI